MTDSHAHSLLLAGRCGRCAERVSRTTIIRGDDCPHCGSSLAWSGGDVLASLEIRRLVWRLTGYALVAAASLAAGTVPLLQFVVQLAALFILHVVVLRRSLLWLAPGRRVVTRVTIKLFGAAIAVVALLINVAIAPFLGLSAFVLAAVGPLLTALYVEGGLVIVRRRLALASQGRPLAVAEWGLPAALLVALLAAIGATVGVVMATVHLIASADIPTISELTRSLLELSP